MGVPRFAIAVFIERAINKLHLNIYIKAIKNRLTPGSKDHNNYSQSVCTEI